MCSSIILNIQQPNKYIKTGEKAKVQHSNNGIDFNEVLMVLTGNVLSFYELIFL